MSETNLLTLAAHILEEYKARGMDDYVKRFIKNGVRSYPFDSTSVMHFLDATTTLYAISSHPHNYSASPTTPERLLYRQLIDDPRFVARMVSYCEDLRTTDNAEEVMRTYKSYQEDFRRLSDKLDAIYAS